MLKIPAGSLRFCKDFPYASLICVAVFLAAGLVTVHPAQAQRKYDPEHPEVQEMIADGLNFIMNNQSNRIGPRIMFGMAAYKAQVVSSPTPDAKKHPLIDAAIKAIRESCTESKLQSSRDFEKMYASALACVFLLELDAEAYENEIQTLLDHILERQQDSGAWGYREYPAVGDTSQMQYIALALWLAKEQKFRVNTAAAKDALQWMVDTQEADGGWIYQKPVGITPQVGNHGRVVRHSLVAAGLGTVYLYADLLKLVDRSRTGKLGPKRNEEGRDLPPDVVDVTNEKNPETVTDGNRALVSFDTGSMYRTINAGNRWFDSNFQADVEDYNLYYLYGYERYAALREYVEGSNKGVEDWYDRGVEFLMDLQANDGSFAKGARGEIPASVQTSFAILFLTRSMSITISDKASGVLPGGMGFDSDVILREVGDRIVGSAVERSISDLIEMLENPEMDELELYLNSLDELSLDGTEVSRGQQLATLRMLVRHERYEARLIAIKFLSKQRSLDNVPAFIFALTDPDPEIVVEANKAMMFVSRKTKGPPISERPSTSEVNTLIRYWTEWYLKVQPDGVLLDMGDENN